MPQDLTKITAPFGLLDMDTQEALTAHGGPYQVWSGNLFYWYDVKVPFWDSVTVYRVKPQPMTKPSIDWSAIELVWKYLIVDRDDFAWLLESKPQIALNSWVVSGRMLRVDGVFTSYTPGTCDWKYSLVERPE